MYTHVEERCAAYSMLCHNNNHHHCCSLDISPAYVISTCPSPLHLPCGFACACLQSAALQATGAAAPPAGSAAAAGSAHAAPGAPLPGRRPRAKPGPKKGSTQRRPVALPEAVDAPTAARSAVNTVKKLSDKINYAALDQLFRGAEAASSGAKAAAAAAGGASGSTQQVQAGGTNAAAPHGKGGEYTRALVQHEASRVAAAVRESARHGRQLEREERRRRGGGSGGGNALLGLGLPGLNLAPPGGVNGGGNDAGTSVDVGGGGGSSAPRTATPARPARLAGLTPAGRLAGLRRPTR